MAEKTLVVPEDERFIQAVSKVVSRLDASHGPLYAALLVRLPDQPADEWTLLVGSPALGKRRVDGINAIVSAMQGVIPAKFASRIRRVDVLRKDDPIYTRLSQAFELRPGVTFTLNSCTVLGLEIDRAVVFAMGKPAPTPVRRRTPSRQRKRRRIT